ncbi:hypothetical protein OHT52_05925 [Streptomyces sp. NBC_00247]|uniref:hypothetical protein n=1 Tax=Streptomyces sp. NBC_00247 TaxID=2975689 RepID=UPI002E2E7646|nr:hypothetical protein [Streptomyces sp. NBC_00247]
MKSILRKAAPPLAVVMSAAVLGGCSGSSDGPGTPSASRPVAPGETGRQVCSGLLRADGGAALEQLTKSARFTESPGSGPTEVRSVADAAQKLRNSGLPATGSGERLYLCLAEPGNPGGRGDFQVSTRWTRIKAGDRTWHSTAISSVYDLTAHGVHSSTAPYATASQTWGAVSLHCPVGGGAAPGVALDVELRTSHGSVTPDEEPVRPGLLLKAAHGAALAVAREVGCLAESSLPETLDAPTPLPKG